jgi:hypothetical protein
MYDTDAVICIEVNPMQFAKARECMVVTVDGIVNAFIIHCPKASSAIVVVFSCRV